MSNLDQKWLKAAIVGGLWASVEIIIGSFLHNIRMPMSGTILGANGVILLIAFDRHWREDGLIWRAGLITALMKSVSPSAVILGPMIGIISEAIFLEIGIRIFGRNYLGYIIGGILGIFSILIHKVVSLLILYGFDVVEIYSNVFRFAVKQIGIQGLVPFDALLILVLFYVAFGLFASIVGIRLTMTGPRLSVAKGYQITDLKRGGERSVHRLKQNYLLLILHVIAIPIVLFLFHRAGFYVVLPWAVIYVALVVVLYPQGLRRIRKPMFWIQLLILLFLSSLFFDGLPGWDSLFSVSGFEVGVQMAFRAVFIVASFSALSVELANPRLRKALELKGFDQLYLSLELAFASLPSIIEALPSPRFALLHPGVTFRLLLDHADRLLEEQRQ
jgi:hypothetical protein